MHSLVLHLFYMFNTVTDVGSSAKNKMTNILVFRKLMFLWRKDTLNDVAVYRLTT